MGSSPTGVVAMPAARAAEAVRAAEAEVEVAGEQARQDLGQAVAQRPSNGRSWVWVRRY
jgi:hypothetical protein